MTARQTARSRKTAATRRSRRYVCPQCGFKAVHAAGLGRHRSAIHGVISKRQRAKRATVRGRATATRPASGDAQLAKRLSEFERRYERLLTGLERVLDQAKRRR